MINLKSDPVARETALRRWVLPECLHVPMAAVDEDAIVTYVGAIERVLTSRTPNRALLVRMPPAPVIDPRLPISELAQAAVLHAPLQVWVHVGLNGYRRAYARAFPTEDISGKVLSHAMNRRSADLRGYQYVRITVASRRANSSSAFSEQWGVALYQRTAADKEKARRGAFIEYASLAELMVMMDMSVGGGVMGLVNDAQHLVKPRP